MYEIQNRVLSATVEIVAQNHTSLLKCRRRHMRVTVNSESRCRQLVTRKGALNQWHGITQPDIVQQEFHPQPVFSIASLLRTKMEWHSCFFQSRCPDSGTPVADEIGLSSLQRFTTRFHRLAIFCRTISMFRTAVTAMCSHSSQEFPIAEVKHTKRQCSSLGVHVPAE